MVNMKKKIILILFCLLINNETFSSPVGKGLSCYSKNIINEYQYEKFRGIYFESTKSVRVVSFKNKNNSLQIISKQTPYKISDDKINFKIKFIWYGNISFENFILNRKTLDLNHELKSKQYNLECSFLSDDFMKEMSKIKSKFQVHFDNELKSNKI